MPFTEKRNQPSFLWLTERVTLSKHWSHCLRPLNRRINVIKKFLDNGNKRTCIFRLSPPPSRDHYTFRIIIGNSMYRTYYILRRVAAPNSETAICVIFALNFSFSFWFVSDWFYDATTAYRERADATSASVHLPRTGKCRTAAPMRMWQCALAKTRSVVRLSIIGR